MRLSGILLLTCALAAGCGGDDSPSTPSTTAPNTITFTATLLPANEVSPAVTNAETSGRGTAIITFNLTRTAAGAIQSGTVDFHYDLTGFPAGTLITLSHIHTGASGVGGGVLINTGQSSASQLGLTSGAGSWESKGVPGDAATLQSIIDNPAGFYFNVHSSTNPSGVARGQLVKQ
jgi:hypothetical protein